MVLYIRINCIEASNYNHIYQFCSNNFFFPFLIYFKNLRQYETEEEDEEEEEEKKEKEEEEEEHKVITGLLSLFTFIPFLCTINVQFNVTWQAEFNGTWQTQIVSI